VPKTKRNSIFVGTTIIVVAVLGYLFFVRSADKLGENGALNPIKITHEIEQGEAVLLDVRTPEELIEEGKAINAFHFDVARLKSGELPDISKDKTIYTYCRSGARADDAKKILESNGFSSVINIGGLRDWLSAGGKIESYIVN